MKKALFSLMAMLLLSFSGVAQTTYTMVTSTSDLEAGATYLLVGYDDDGNAYAMSYQKPNNRHAISINEANGVITATVATDASSQTEPFEITLDGAAGAWTLYDGLNEGYLYAPGGGNYLKTQSSLTDNGYWTITEGDNGAFIPKSNGAIEQCYMRFNINNSGTGTPLFGCYKESSSVIAQVYFFKSGSVTPPTPDPEPSNYPTNFSATVNEVDVTLTWTDATGEQLPAKYLVMATTGEITLPVDGTPVANSEIFMNVNYGVETATFSGLEGGTTYRFAIFPYTNSGSNIDYLTSGNYPVIEVTTESINYLLFEDFNESESLGVFTAYDAYGDQSWHQGAYQGTTYANMNGFAAGAAHQNEDWLIGEVPGVTDVQFTDIFLEFRTAMKFDGDPLRVSVSGDYDGQSDPSDFTWTDITDAFDYSSGDYDWVESGKVNIIDIVGEFANSGNSWYVAFIYGSSDEAASSWEIDYVKVSGLFTASANENNTVAVSLYPNPASDQVSFVLDNDAEVSIFDMTGRKVNTMNVAAGNTQLNVSELESGVYFVNFRYANGSTAISKFVKF